MHQTRRCRSFQCRHTQPDRESHLRKTLVINQNSPMGTIKWFDGEVLGENIALIALTIVSDNCAYPHVISPHESLSKMAPSLPPSAPNSTQVNSRALRGIQSQVEYFYITPQMIGLLHRAFR